jgi:hypothetical protein
MINFIPAFGANAYDGFMAGMAFYNSVFPSKNFEYAIMPLYSIRNNKTRGYGSVSYRFHARQSSFIHSIKPGLHFSSFGIIPLSSLSVSNSESNYLKLAPSLEIKFKKKKARGENQHSIFYRFVHIEEFQKGDCETCVDPYDVHAFQRTDIHEFNYKFENSNTIHPWNIKNTTRYHEDFTLNMTEANYKHIYNERGNAFHARLFAGVFLNNDSYSGRYNIRMDGQRGYHDYMYDEVFPARFETEGMWSQQFIESYGAFKIPTALGQSNKWLVALNLKADLPIPILFPFVDLGAGAQSNSVRFLYDAGIGINIGKGLCAVYFPLIFSKEIKNELTVNNKKFKDQIRFTFNLPKMNPLQKVRSF